MSQRASAVDDYVGALTHRVVPFLLVVVTMAAAVRKAATPVTNADAYFHLRFGHEFLHGGWRAWHPGHVSSFEHADWVPTQWLSQVTMAAVEDRFGLAGIAWLSGLSYVLFVLALFWAARRRAALLPAAVLVPFAIVACWSNITARPQVASFILTAVTVAVWQTARDRSSVPWLLIPVTWVWAMLHGMWPVGIAIGVAAALGIVLDTRPGRRQALRLFAVPALSLVAAGLTPVGPRLYSAVLLVNSRNEFFGEWGAPDFRSPQIAMLLVLLAATIVLLAKAPVVSWFDALLLLGALACSVYSQRTVPVAAAMLVPLAAAAADRLLQTRTSPSRRETASVAGVTVAMLVVLGIAVPSTSAEPLVQPPWIDAEVGRLAPGTPVLDDMVFGSYLLWKYPHLDLVSHGYGDVYTDHELEERGNLETLEPGWDDFVRSTGALIAVERPDSRVTYALVSAGWSLRQHNDDVALLTAPADWLASGHSS